MKIYLILLLLFASVCACQTDVNCTTPFESVTLKVSGDTLTDFYTVRLSTSDTIRRATGYESRTHQYVILDDSYQRNLVNKQDVFRFIGKIGTTIVVQEEYRIEADRCHIRKVSGQDEVQL